MSDKEECPYPPGTYRINREASDICNKWRMGPKDLICWMNGELSQRWDGREIEVKMEGAVRKVCQVEGVMLHEKGKGFFRELFADLIKAVTGRGGK